MVIQFICIRPPLSQNHSSTFVYGQILIKIYMNANIMKTQFFHIFIYDLKCTLYIRNLKYAHLTLVFRQQYVHLVFTTCQHKYKWILCTKKTVSNASFQDF